MVNSKIKAIHENSVVIIFKFGSPLQKNKVIQNEAFQKSKAHLESIAVQNGGVSEYFTH